MTTGPRLLVVTPFTPSLDAVHGGGRIVAQGLLRRADRQPTALLALRGTDDPPVCAALRRALDVVIEIPTAPIGRSVRRFAAEPGRILSLARRDPDWVVAAEVREARRRLAVLVETWRPEIVQLEFLAMGRYATAISRPGPPVVLVHHDAAADGRDTSSPSWARHARRALAHVDALVVFSESDRLRVDSLAPKQVAVIRPGFDIPSLADPADEDGVLFVGSFLHEPNLEAARRLVDVIHPLVRERLPNTELTIVGADPPPSLARGPGVRLTGRVSEIAPYVDAAAVVVAPLASGAGVRIKVLDALARGKALVATRRALEGLELVDGEHVLVRDDDQAFADAIVRLLESDDSRRRLGTAARTWAEANLSWDAALESYDRLYAELLR